MYRFAVPLFAAALLAACNASSVTDTGTGGGSGGGGSGGGTSDNPFLPENFATSTVAQRAEFLAENPDIDFVTITGTSTFSVFTGGNAEYEVDLANSVIRRFTLNERAERFGSIPFVIYAFDRDTGRVTGSTAYDQTTGAVVGTNFPGALGNVKSLFVPAIRGDHARVALTGDVFYDPGVQGAIPPWDAFADERPGSTQIPLSGSASYSGDGVVAIREIAVTTAPGASDRVIHEAVTASVGAVIGFDSGQFLFRMDDFDYPGVVGALEYEGELLRDGNNIFFLGNSEVVDTERMYAKDGRLLNERNRSVTVITGSGDLINFAGPGTEEIFGRISHSAGSATDPLDPGANVRAASVFGSYVAARD